MAKRDIVPPEYQVYARGIPRRSHRAERFMQLHLNDLPSIRNAHAKSLRTVATRFKERWYSPKIPTNPPQNSANIIENGRTCFPSNVSHSSEIWSRIHQITKRRNRARWEVSFRTLSSTTPINANPQQS